MQSFLFWAQFREQNSIVNFWQQFFKNIQKRYFQGFLTPLLLEYLTWRQVFEDSCSALKMASKTLGAILFAKSMQGCVITQLTYFDKQLLGPEQTIWAHLTSFYGKWNFLDTKREREYYVAKGIFQEIIFNDRHWFNASTKFLI